MKDFIEVGVLLKEPETVDRICLYVPHSVATTELTDCANYFARAPIAQGIFNEMLSATDPPQGRFVQLRNSTKVFCRVHRFMRDNTSIDPTELTCDTIADGTLLTITSTALNEARKNALNDPAPVYFRLRIAGRSVEQAFVRQIATPDRMLQSGFVQIEYIDFRVNEARTLPEQVEAKMSADSANVGVQLVLVAFLTAVPVQSELSSSNATPHKLRVLEHGLWSDYVPGGIPDGMVVYHWKRETASSIRDFSAFVKLQTRRSGRWTLLKYLAFAFAFGVLGNMVASVLEYGLDKGWEAAFGKPDRPSISVSPKSERQ